MNLKNKAILIENPNQLRTFRKLCNSTGIDYITQEFCNPFYFMLFKTACGWYAIPNTELDSDECSISSYNFRVLSLNQYKKEVEVLPITQIKKESKKGDF